MARRNKKPIESGRVPDELWERVEPVLPKYPLLRSTLALGFDEPRSSRRRHAQRGRLAR